MPKYLFHANYVGDGIKGLLKDGGSKRRATEGRPMFQGGGERARDKTLGRR